MERLILATKLSKESSYLSLLQNILWSMTIDIFSKWSMLSSLRLVALEVIWLPSECYIDSIWVKIIRT